jgi:hypothetical protein
MMCWKGQSRKHETPRTGLWIDPAAGAAGGDAEEELPCPPLAVPAVNVTHAQRGACLLKAERPMDYPITRSSKAPPALPGRT